MNRKGSESRWAHRAGLFLRPEPPLGCSGCSPPSTSPRGGYLRLAPKWAIRHRATPGAWFQAGGVERDPPPRTFGGPAGGKQPNVSGVGRHLPQPGAQERGAVGPGFVSASPSPGYANDRCAAWQPRGRGAGTTSQSLPCPHRLPRGPRPAPSAAAPEESGFPRFRRGQAEGSRSA